MFASEFFREVEGFCGLECSNVVAKVGGIKFTRVMYKNKVMEGPELLLVLKDLYLPNVYMYARFIGLSPSQNKIEILDSDARELGDLRIEGVSMEGTEIVIEAMFVGSD